MERKLLTEEEKKRNRVKAVEKYMQKVERVNVILPKGTCDEIRELGVSCNEFIRNATLDELEKIKRYKK